MNHDTNVIAADYAAVITHTEKTFEKLAHMQYDLFCKGNRVSRTMLSIGAILLGIVNSGQWWGMLAIGYGFYLTSSTYSSANHTAHKLAKKIRETGMDFPSSRYEFTEQGMRIISLPDEKVTGKPVKYEEFLKLGEDADYFYLFPNPHGGYMISKEELAGEDDFRWYLQEKTGKNVQSRVPPVVKLMRKLQRREKEPYHL